MSEAVIVGIFFGGMEFFVFVKDGFFYAVSAQNDPVGILPEKSKFDVTVLSAWSWLYLSRRRSALL